MNKSSQHNHQNKSQFEETCFYQNMESGRQRISKQIVSSMSKRIPSNNI